MGTPNREPQAYSRNILGIYLPGSSFSSILIFLLYSWGSLFGVPIKVPLIEGCDTGTGLGSWKNGVQHEAMSDEH